MTSQKSNYSPCVVCGYPLPPKMLREWSREAGMATALVCHLCHAYVIDTAVMVADSGTWRRAIRAIRAAHGKILKEFL